MYLIAAKVKTCMGILEEIWHSPYVLSRKCRLQQECVDNEELECICVDCTLRVARRIQGQADYRLPKAVRESAVFPDAVALKSICTVRGRTAAVIGIWLARGENTEYIVDRLARELSVSYRAQVRNIFSDMPSKMFLVLKPHFMNSESLALDPVHLAIIYEVSNFRKSTPGSRFLRRILCKFNKAS